MTLDTPSHSSLNPFIHLSTSSERKHTGASCAPYTIRLDGWCLTHIMTFGPFAFARGAYQASGATRVFGITASHVAESRRTLDDWMNNAGIACESAICKGSNTEGPALMEALTGATVVIWDGG